jgi:citrate synthase
VYNKNKYGGFMNAKNTGRMIAFLRKQKGWTQVELAKKLGISDRTISKWESGSGYPDISELPILAEIFDVTIDFIINNEDVVVNYAIYESVTENYNQVKNQNRITSDIRNLAQIFKENGKINEKLYAENDVKKGLRDVNGNGVRAGLTAISEVLSKKIVNGEKVPCDGELYYRGVNVEDLIKNYGESGHFGFEEVVYLLLFGKLPNKQELQDFCKMLAKYRTLPTNFVRDVILKAPSADIINSMSKSILTLNSYDANANDISLDNVLRQCIKLISVFPLLAIYGYQAFAHYKDNQSLIIHNPSNDFSTAENILRLLRHDKKFTKTEAMVLDIALILHAEHGGGNNSTFTTHVVTSSGTDTYSAMTAALCSLKGPKHGGANRKVVEMFADIKSNVKEWSNKEELTAYIAKILDGEAYDKSGLVYGMGHAVYSISDPRAVVFKAVVRKLSQEKGLEKEFALYDDVEDIAKELICKKRKIYKGVSANVDFYSGFAYNMLGLPEELYTPIFAIARVAGWSAHRMEELLNAGKIIRPAYISVAEKKDYVAIDKR